MKYIMMATLMLAAQAHGSQDDDAKVQWAMTDVMAAVSEAKVQWAKAEVVVEAFASKDIKAEGFKLAIIGNQARLAWGDSSGAMYGLLELAEQIRNGGGRDEWAKVVATLSATRQEPFLEFRASNQFIHTTPRLLLDDVGMWKRYIDLLARSRFNVLDLHGGYDLDSTLFPNLYPLLVTVKEYPAVGIPDDQRRNLGHLREIAVHAHRRGVKVAFMNYEAGGNGAPKDGLADYTARAVAALLRGLPELDMLGFRVGESGQPAGFFQDAYLKGLADSGRKDVRIYTRSWWTTRDALEKIAKACDGSLDIEVKYNGEQLGLPYQAIHGDDDPTSASYSYEGYIRGDAPYRIIWQVRANGTHRYWAWEDTEFIRRCVGTLALGDARGFTLESPTAYFPVDADTYYVSPEDRAVYDYIWEKHWMTFMAWGRLAYDPKLPEETLVAAFSRRLGQHGRDVYRAMQAASKVVPLVLAYRYLGPDHRDHSPETETGDERSVTMRRTEFSGNQPMDNRNFIGIQQFVANKISGKPDGRVGPERIAGLLASAAAEARAAAALVIIDLGRADDEWRLLKVDLLAAAALGEYYAARIRGSMHMAYALRVASDEDYRKATAFLAEARKAWEKLSETTDHVYAPLDNPLRDQHGWLWGQALGSLDDLLPTAGRPMELTPADRGQDTGIVINVIHHDIDPAGFMGVTCWVQATTPVKKVILWHKKLPSTDKWQPTLMAGDGEGRFSASVPLTAEGLMYQVEIRDAAGAAAIFPQALRSTPYWAITPADRAAAGVR